MKKKKRPPNPGLNPLLTYKHRRWAHDQDYVDKLSDTEKEWLNKFNQEYLQNTFRRDGTDLHSTDESRRELYNRTNASHRDAMHQWIRTDMLQIENLEDEDEK